jgi:hypothetical protein
MMTKKLLPAKFWGLAVLISATSVAGLALKRVFAQKNNRSRVEVNWLRKSLTPEKGQTTGFTSLTIRLNALRSGDKVNVRPEHGNEPEIAVCVIPQLSRQAMAVSEPMPEDTLQTNQAKSSFALLGEITFSRPKDIDRPVFVDIKVPADVSVKLLADDEVMMSSQVREPTAVQVTETAKAVGPGTANPTALLMQTMLTGVLAEKDKNAPLSNTTQPIGNTGKYFVPFEQLQVQHMVAPQGDPAQMGARIEINENGEVVKVRPVSETPPIGFAEALKQWRFAPYIVEGRAVTVQTVIQLTP